MPRRYVHVAAGLKGEGGGGPAARTCEASEAAARVSVPVTAQHGGAGSSVLTAVLVAARKRGRARLSPVEMTVLALLGTKAREAVAVALAHAAVLARLPFTSAEDFCAQSAWTEERKVGRALGWSPIAAAAQLNTSGENPYLNTTSKTWTRVGRRSTSSSSSSSTPRTTSLEMSSCAAKDTEGKSACAPCPALLICARALWLKGFSWLPASQIGGI